MGSIKCEISTRDCGEKICGKQRIEEIIIDRNFKKNAFASEQLFVSTFIGFRKSSKI